MIAAPVQPRLLAPDAAEVVMEAHLGALSRACARYWRQFASQDVSGEGRQLAGLPLFAGLYACPARRHGGRGVAGK